MGLKREELVEINRTNAEEYGLPKRFFLDPNLVEPSTEGSDIVAFFQKKYVLVTGATGYIGKLVVEKILRLCPDVGGVFVLVRPKKGKDVHDRVTELYNDVVYERLRNAYPNFKEKIFPVAGDTGLLGLGLSKEDRAQIISKVAIILHGAATVRMTDSLRTVGNINVRGTIEMLSLAKECKNLASFVHVSTAFTHCPRRVIEDQFYDPPMEANFLLELLEKFDNHQLEEMTPGILGRWPNTYTFSKVVAEEAVQSSGKDLPTSVVRPSMIISTYNDPVPGWIDNYYGPIGFLVGFAIGLLRTMRCNVENVGSIVPADYVVNTILAAAQRASVLPRSNNPHLYNVDSREKNPITWRQLYSWGLKNFNVPSIRTVWYPAYVVTGNQRLVVLLRVFLHLIPGAIMDLALIVMNKKPQFLETYKKVHANSDLVQMFTAGEWEIRSKAIAKMHDELNAVDKKLFSNDLGEIVWKDYVECLGMGFRKYLVKEDINTLVAAKKKFKRLHLIHQIFRAVMAAIALYILYKLIRVFI